MNTQPNTETLEGKIAVMQAAKEGKRIQCTCYINPQDEKDWKNIEGNIQWTWNILNYRINPDDLEPLSVKKWRAWTFNELPLGAQIKLIHTSSTLKNYRGIICHVTGDRILISTGYNPSFECLLNNYEHSLDQGKTWLPCGVKE